ncbi:ROK family protein [Marinoscillum sp. MHG1-6]|uniref:ROK family protein n=1 Tax=Marinoscillum sp. MHG1-6 TaxID=2959627 RepID=UPI002157CBE4|nr:ROK family protein [Marinoscillum sp. MHG1-6]
MSKKLAVGIDIGGTLTKVGLVDREGELFVHEDFSTVKYEDFGEYLDHLQKLVQELRGKLDFEHEIVGYGVGAPNANYYRGTIEYAANLKWKGVVPFSEEFGKRFDHPVYITNDASAAAIGEMIYGNAQNMKDFMVITLGTGLGSGIVCNGKLVYGFDSQAGELGHVVIDPNGRMTGLGRRGGLEAYVSSTGIKRTVFHLLSDSLEDSVLRNYSYNNLHGETITKAAEDGDPIAIKAFEMTGRILGEQLANFTTFSHPEAFFLLGGLAKAGEWIFEPTRRHLEGNLLPFYKGKVKLLPSGMLKKNAAILGAAALVWDHE